MVLGITRIVCGSFAIYLFQKLLDSIGAMHSISDGVRGCLHVFVLYAVMMFLDHVFGYVTQYPEEKLKNSVLYQTKLMVLRKMECIDYNQYTNWGLGSTIQVVENGASAALNMLVDFWLYLFSELIPTIFISVIFIGMYDINTFTYIIAGYLLVFVATKLIMNKLLFIKDDILTNEQFLNNRLVRGIMEVFLFRVEKMYKKEFKYCEETASQIINARTKLKMLHELFFTLFVIFVLIVKIFVIFNGIMRISAQDPTYTVGIIVALVSFIDRLYDPIASFNVRLVDYRLNKPALQRLEAILDSRESANIEAGNHFVMTSCNIIAKDLRFSIGENRILNHFDISIRDGSSVAIIGASGSGKSSFIKLLLGINQDYLGSLRIDDKEINEICLNEFYDHISIVTQDAPIFADTIRENLVMGSQENYSDNRLYEALDAVGLKELVQGLDNQLMENVGEKGVKLSGGERQRLAMARVFLHERRLLILDECTSNIDSIMEKRIFEQLLDMRHSTIISVMHRLSNINQFDCILVVDSGKVVGNGTFQELLDGNKVFQTLWNSFQNEGNR